MQTFAIVLMTALAVVCLGIPLVAITVVYREELLPLGQKLRTALAFDPRHPDLDYHFGR